MVALKDFARLLFSLVNAVLVAGVPVQLLLLGDANQLQPVEQGKPFEDVIESNVVPIFRLTRVYRAEYQKLSDFCLATFDKFWTLDPDRRDSLQTIAAPHVVCHFLYDDDDIFKTVDKIVQKILDEHGVFPMVVTKMNDHCKQIAASIRRIYSLTTSGTVPTTPHGHDSFVRGDVVLFKTNTKHWKNGDTGTILNSLERQIPMYTVMFHSHNVQLPDDEDRDDDVCVVDNSEAMEHGQVAAVLGERHIAPSTCRTVHRCQGSTYKHVIFVKTGHRSSFFPCKRAHYTAYSRASQSLHIVAPLKTVNGEHPRKAEIRTTLLESFLRA
jgi:ATP-dependent exoDNAse (exonuclease V) alpha subunit